MQDTTDKVQVRAADGETITTPRWLREVIASKGKDAAAEMQRRFFARELSIVGQRYRCMDPESPHLGELVQVRAHGYAPQEPVIAQVVTGEDAGVDVRVPVQAFFSNYIEG